MQERHSPALGDLHQQTLKRIVGLVENLLTRFQGEGKIRADLDISLMAFVVVQVQMGMLDFLRMQDDQGIDEAATMATVDQFISVLQAGLKPATS